MKREKMQLQPNINNTRSSKHQKVRKYSIKILMEIFSMEIPDVSGVLMGLCHQILCISMSSFPNQFKICYFMTSKHHIRHKSFFVAKMIGKILDQKILELSLSFRASLTCSLILFGFFLRTIWYLFHADVFVSFYTPHLTIKK